MHIKRYMQLLGCLLLASLTSSCQLFSSNQPGWEINKKRYRQAEVETTSISISLHDQKAWLLDGQGRVVLKTDVSTGVTDYETPVGEYKVLEMLVDKRSNLYGQYVESETKKVVVPKTWLHEGPPPEGSEYQGISMPYWMRLTWDGVGMHVGKFPKRTRCSFGCIRVVDKAQPMIFRKTRVGTPVVIHGESLMLQMAEREKFRRWAF